MDIAFLLEFLYEKDNAQAFDALKQLEKISEESNVLYPFIDKFMDMAKNEKYVIKVRGFRLLCKQAKWDNQNQINQNLEDILNILYDEKPTAVRQSLAALKDIVIHKKELQALIKDKVLKIDYLKYKDTMHGLIAKDIQNILDIMD